MTEEGSRYPRPVPSVGDDSSAAQRAADPGLDHETPLSEVFEDQIACADVILLTKADLAGPEGVAAARAAGRHPGRPALPDDTIAAVVAELLPR